MCVTVLGHRDGCYAGKVCSFLLHYLSKKEVLAEGVPCLFIFQKNNSY